MVHPHGQRSEEGATVPLQPQEAEEIWLVTKNTPTLLQMHNWEHPVRLYLCLVPQLLRPQPQGSPEGSEVCTTHHGGKLPALQDTYITRCHRKAKKIIKDNNHPSHCLFPPLSSRRQGQYRCIKAGTERLKNSFYLKAITLLNRTSLHWVAAANILTQISSHFKNYKLDVINVSLVTLDNATLYNVYLLYITHPICIYCTLYHLLHFAYAVRPSLIHIFICTYS